MPKANLVVIRQTIVSIEDELKRGHQAARRCMAEKVDIPRAFHHSTLGPVSLIWGSVRDNKGVSHILHRREQEIAGDQRFADQNPTEVVLKLIEVILKGTVSGSTMKKVFDYDGFLAVVVVEQGELWLLSGYKKTPKRQ